MIILPVSLYRFKDVLLIKIIWPIWIFVNRNDIMISSVKIT